MEWGKLFFIIGAIGMLFFLYQAMRSKPGWFSSEHLQKSIFTTGVLAILLILFIGLLVLLLKS